MEINNLKNTFDFEYTSPSGSTREPLRLFGESPATTNPVPKGGCYIMKLGQIFAYNFRVFTGWRLRT